MRKEKGETGRGEGNGLTINIEKSSVIFTLRQFTLIHLKLNISCPLRHIHGLQKNQTTWQHHKISNLSWNLKHPNSSSKYNSILNTIVFLGLLSFIKVLSIHNWPRIRGLLTDKSNVRNAFPIERLMTRLSLFRMNSCTNLKINNFTHIQE